MGDSFRRFAAMVSRGIGSAGALVVLSGLVMGSGWEFGFSDPWKLNTGLISSVAALFLLVFLQKSQNHSDKATHLKLDELIRAVEGARNELREVEDQPEASLEDLKGL